MTFARARALVNFRVEGCTSQVAPSGAPKQESEAVPVAPARANTMGTIAAVPAMTRLASECVVRVGRAMVSVGFEPVPETAAVCGLPAPLSSTDRLPLLVVSDTGWKVTKTVQAEPALSVAGQLLVCE